MPCDALRRLQRELLYDDADRHPRGPCGRVLQAYDQAQPWVLLTDTPVALTEPTLYACRNWIEQGSRGLKTVGWKWHKTRRRSRRRVARHWLVLAIAILLAVFYGTRR